MKCRWLLTILILGMLSALGVGYYYYLELEQSMLPPSDKNKVLGTPDAFNFYNVVKPYAGEHPRFIKRPQDPFQFPILPGQTGPITPLFAGPMQYPFLCQTEESGLGQPIIDNHSGVGIPVYEVLEDGTINKDVIKGYSQDCALPTQVHYYYQLEAKGKYTKLSPEALIRAQSNLHSLPDAKHWLRIETGTINRFIYALLLPIAKEEIALDSPSSRWNNKLIYHFKGGISIGFHQGILKLKHITKDLEQSLNDGYAIAYSTGTETSNHYDIWLSEDTAMRVKKQFITRYGEPLYTVGLGGSGGAIQQYLLAQNRPGIIDAGIAQYSYPDMVTQISYALDCELFDYYFDVLDEDNEHWQDWENRERLLGLSHVQGAENKYGHFKMITDILRFKWPSAPAGASECSNGWRGPHATINNPAFNADYFQYSEDIRSRTQWSHWSNLVSFYGTDDQGWANSLFDNEGVQYGLAALKTGDINVETFISLNQHIGGWKPQSEMENEYYWHFSGQGELYQFKLWSQHNMTHNGEKNMAARTQANPGAVAAAYKSGHLFTGLLEIPIIDLRHYLDETLDIHHSWASFSTRQRIESMFGKSDQQLIWTAMKPHNPVPDALEAIDQWMMNIRENPQKSLASNRPANINDRCYDESGTLVFDGKSAWDGNWNQRPEGPCLQKYPMKSSSRLIAGDNMQSETLKCALQPVAKAIENGLYHPVDMTPYLSQLESTFPTGVCDYEQTPIGKPSTLMERLKASAQSSNVH